MPVSSGTNARVLVYNVVTAWLGEKIGLPPQRVNVMRKFQGAPPAGYSQTGGSFMTMCDDISATLSSISGRSVTLTNAWRTSHQADVIAAFINAVAVVLLSAPMSAVGKKSLGWAMKIDNP